MAVPSPCLHVCTLDPATGLCEGCWRTLEEISAWSALGDADKLRVWRGIRARKAEASAARESGPAAAPCAPRRVGSGRD